MISPASASGYQAVGITIKASVQAARGKGATDDSNEALLVPGRMNWQVPTTVGLLRQLVACYTRNFGSGLGRVAETF